MKNTFLYLIVICFSIIFYGCNPGNSSKKDIIFDTDTNNELDDQHALAYLILNDPVFNILGVTVNATRNGGNITEHYKEADRIIKLCKSEGKFKLLKGADKSFEEIKSSTHLKDFDGHAAVDFIINEANKYSEKNKLTILAVGKLTNIALALKKDPSISHKIRLCWLGSNYPDPGEYNLEDDIPSMNYVLESDIHFELIPCHYNKPTGTDAVKVSKEEILKNMPKQGPKAKQPVTGRHQDKFEYFGDYSVNLFMNAECYGNPPSRSLFDMAAVAIVKNGNWAQKREIPCPIMKNGKWIDRPNNSRKIILWENFDKKAIIADFFETMKNNK